MADRADVKNVIKDQLNVRQFVLVSSDQRASSSQWPVEVADALSAECLRESLTITHDHYKPTSGNLLSRGIDRLFGEVTKGYQVIRQLTLDRNLIFVYLLDECVVNYASFESSEKLLASLATDFPSTFCTLYIGLTTYVPEL